MVPNDLHLQESRIPELTIFSLNDEHPLRLFLCLVCEGFFGWLDFFLPFVTAAEITFKTVIAIFQKQYFREVALVTGGL